MPITWHLESRKLKDLTEHPHNPRQLSKHDAEHLEKSLEKFGQIDKIVINTDNQIIGGHQRKKILKKMGISTVECWVPDRTLDPKEVDECVVRLNRNAGEWDWDILANRFDNDDLLEFGFEASELGLADSFDSGEADDEKKDEEQCQRCPVCNKKMKVKK
jgi:hypothetical protein